MTSVPFIESDESDDSVAEGLRAITLAVAAILERGDDVPPALLEEGFRRARVMVARQC